MPTAFLPLLLVAHIVLALALVLPSIVLPFALRGDRPADASGRFVQTLLRLQTNGTLVIGLGLALTGAALVIVLGSQLLSKPWLLVALAIYAANLLLVFFIQRPSLRRLLGRAGSDEAGWRAQARRRAGRATCRTRWPAWWGRSAT